MKNWYFIIGLILAFVLILPSHVLAAPQSQLNYQAKLMDKSGNVVQDGTYSVRFAIYTQETGGDSVWSESRLVSVSAGVFSVMLGSVESLNLDFTSSAYYLGTKIGSDSELSPRKRIGAAPFAVNSAYLDGSKAGTGANEVLKLGSAGEINIGGTITADGLIKANNGFALMSGSLTLPTGIISTAMLADESVTSVKLASNISITTINSTDIINVNNISTDTIGVTGLLSAGRGIMSSPITSNIGQMDGAVLFLLQTETAAPIVPERAALKLATAGSSPGDWLILGVHDDPISGASNIFNVDYQGNAYIAGGVQAGGDLLVGGNLILGSETSLFLVQGDSQIGNGAGDVALIPTGATLQVGAGATLDVTGATLTGFPAAAAAIEKSPAGSTNIITPTVDAVSLTLRPLQDASAVANVLDMKNTSNTSVLTISKTGAMTASGLISANGGVSGNVTGSLTGAASLNLLKAGDTMGGELNMGWNDITNVDHISISGGPVGLTITTGSDFQGTISNTTGDLTIGDNLVVTGTSDFRGNIFNSTGDLTVDDNLSIGGNITLSTANATVDGVDISTHKHTGNDGSAAIYMSKSIYIQDPKNGGLTQWDWFGFPGDVTVTRIDIFANTTVGSGSDAEDGVRFILSDHVPGPGNPPEISIDLLEGSNATSWTESPQDFDAQAPGEPSMRFYTRNIETPTGGGPVNVTIWYKAR
jgi:hypothetical protein